MGLFNRRKNWVRGTAQVVATSDYKPNVSAQNIALRAIIEGPGIAPFDSEQRFTFVRSRHWPQTGQVLPVLINPRQPSDWKVLWDEAESDADRADQLAAQMLAERQPGAAGGPVPGVPAELLGQIQSMFPGATISVGDAAIPNLPTPSSGGQTFNVVAGQSSEDPVARLEKLARLHAAGVVDDAQFAQLKAQILGQAGG